MFISHKPWFHRCLTLTLSFALVLGCVAGSLVRAEEPVLLDVKESYVDSGKGYPAAFDGAAQQEILTRIIPMVRSKAGVPDRLSEFTSSFSFYGSVRINLTWSVPYDKGAYESISVECDTQGRILSYNRYQEARFVQSSDYFPRMSKTPLAEKIEAMVAFALQLAPELDGQLIIDPERAVLSAGSYATYCFPRHIEGIPVLGEGVYLYYDSRQEMITGFSRQWSDDLETIEQPLGILSPEEARAAFAEKVGLELVYKATTYDPYRVAYPDWNPRSRTLTAPYLVYRMPPLVNPVIDPFSGEIYDRGVSHVNEYGRMYPQTTAMGMGSSLSYDMAYILSPEEKLAADEMSALLPVEELAAFLASF